MNVSLTPELQKFVAKRVRTGRYQTASEVVRAGLRLLELEERQRRFSFASRAELEHKLLEGLESGNAAPMTDTAWRKLRRRVALRKNSHS